MDERLNARSEAPSCVPLESRRESARRAMTMHHKAYAFDWFAFHEQLAPLLAAALRHDDARALISFVRIHLSELRDPDEGSPLEESVLQELAVADVQRVADIAMTRYYDPNEIFGAGDAWLALDAVLGEDRRSALLGAPFGESGMFFDPGRMGSYFQTPPEAERSLELLDAFGDPRLDEMRRGMRRALERSMGIYVTF